MVAKGLMNFLGSQWYSKLCLNVLFELFSPNWIGDLFLCAQGVKFCILVFFINTQKGKFQALVYNFICSKPHICNHLAVV